MVLVIYVQYLSFYNNNKALHFSWRKILHVWSVQVPVPLLEHAILSVSMFDRLGRKFDNFSSIFMEWKSSDLSLATLERVLDSSVEELGQRTTYHRKFFDTKTPASTEVLTFKKIF